MNTRSRAETRASRLIVASLRQSKGRIPAPRSPARLREYRGQDSTPSSVDACAAAINRFLARKKTTTIELGKFLYSARRRLHYGQWSQLWVRRRVAMPKRTADMLVTVGKNLGTLDEQNCAQLPWAQNTLYHLALLDRAILLRLIAKGRIHPALTNDEAKEILAMYKPRLRGRRVPVKKRVAGFREFVRDTVNEWTPEEREHTRLEILELADQLGHYASRAGFPKPQTLPRSVPYFERSHLANHTRRATPAHIL